MTKRKYLLKQDNHDPRDFVFKVSRLTENLPTKADLRDKMPPVVDQGELGSCTANAIVSGLREYLLMQEDGYDTHLSRLFLYWHERYFENTVNEDSGAFIRDGMRVLAEIGVAPESYFPYDVSKFTQTPSPDAEKAAASFKIDEYHRVLSITDMKHALVDGLPVVAGITVYDSFESSEVARTGVVPMPNKATENKLGGHAILIVGYDDEKQWVICRNSWGEGWGDRGYFYLPYTFVNDYQCMQDMWTGTIKKAVSPLTTKDAIDYLASKGIIDSPDFWTNLAQKYENDETSDFRFIGLLMQKVVTYMENK